MNTLEAHGRLAARDDLQELLPGDFSRGGCDYTAAFAVALARLSGGLDDAATDAELADAVRHGLSLISSEILALDELATEAEAVLQELAEWGERAEAELARVSASN